MASNRLTQKETDAILEEMRQKRVESVKSFFTGMAKAATTDLPGFLMDVADKLAGDTATLGEKDRSAQLFEKMTGIKTKSGEGGVPEFLGSLVNPGAAVGAAKAIIAPAAIINSAKASAAVAASTKGMRGEDLWKNFGVYPDPATGQLKAVIPDTNAKLNPAAFDPLQHGYMSDYSANSNPSRVTSLAGGVFNKFELKDVLDHPELYNIADLAGVDQTTVRPLILSSALGSFDPDNNLIRLAGDRDPNQILSTLLHEVQHRVQAGTGTQGGGNTSMFFADSAKFKEAKTKASELSRLLEREFDTAFKDTPGLEGTEWPASRIGTLKMQAEEGLESAEKKLAKIPVKTLKAYNQVVEAEDAYKALNTANDLAYKNYTKILGEAEARLVQTQQRLNDYTTYPPKLMAEELGVNVDDLAKILIQDPSITPKVDASQEVQDAIKFVEQLINARAAAKKNP